MKRDISRLALLAALSGGQAMLPGQVLAQTEEPQDLGTISLTVSGEQVDLSRTGASVSVVLAEDLKKVGDLSVAGQLARLPGVSMSRNGGLGTSATLRLRGLGGPYIGVRIDGIDVADTSGIACEYNFGTTTIGGMSRIEVLKGSQSALFGSEAIGGVIDMTTYRATREGVSGEASLEGGSANSWAGSASLGVKGERGELAISASRTITDGISAYGPGVEKDAFRSSSLSFYGEYAVTEGLTLGANGFLRNSYLEYDSQTADTADTEDGKLRGGRLFARFDTGAVSHELAYARTETTRYYPVGGSNLYLGDRDQLSYKGRWTANEQISLNWGLDSTREDFSVDGTGHATGTDSVYAEVLYAARPDLDLSLALRHDEHDDFGGQLSGRAALAWRPGEDWILRAVASTGFRAPSLYQLYGPYGNAMLEAETSESYELGAEYLFSTGSVKATLFNTEIDNRIDWHGSGYNQVPGVSRVRGVELEASVALNDDWSVFGNYTYTDAHATNITTLAEERLLRVPRNDFMLGIEGRLAQGLTGTLTVQHVTGLLDNNLWPTPGRSALKDYTLANIAVSYELSDSAQAFVRVENLFDEKYETVRNYGQPGRQVFVGLRTTF